MNAPLARASYRPHHKRPRRVTAVPPPRPSLRVFNPDTFRAILKVALHMSDEQMRPRARAMVQAIVDDEPGPAALYDRLAEVSKLPETEISGFIQTVFDVQARYLRPEGP